MATLGLLEETVEFDSRLSRVELVIGGLLLSRDVDIIVIAIDKAL